MDNKFDSSNLEAIIKDCAKFNSSNDKNISYSLSYYNNNGKINIDADINGKKISASSMEEFIDKINKKYYQKKKEDSNCAENKNPKIVIEEKPKTVVLNNLEWMAKNLSGHDGIEINGNWYYTWDQAKKAAKEIGNGWRLPTQEEIETLCNLDNVWDDEKRGRWFGKNKELFLPASGCCYRESKVQAAEFGVKGNYWSSSSSKLNPNYAIFLRFGSYACLNPLTDRLSVSARLVRDINLIKDEEDKNITCHTEIAKIDGANINKDGMLSTYAMSYGPEWYSKPVKFGGLEWLGGNLSGFGGTKIDGNTYYTYDQAKKALDDISKIIPYGGWRLPTQNELKKLINCENEIKHNCMLFGKKHNLAFPLLGYLIEDKIMYKHLCGIYWCANNEHKITGKKFLYVNTSTPVLMNNDEMANYGFSIRLVRDMK